MSSHLATTEHANLILKLYELRTESVLREARTWITRQFWPRTAEEVFAVFDDPLTRENEFLRQVTSYWEMAACFVLHGALSADLFVDCHTEPFYLYAKFLPILPAIHLRSPHFLEKTGQLIEGSSIAKARVEKLAQVVAERQSAVLAR